MALEAARLETWKRRSGPRPPAVVPAAGPRPDPDPSLRPTPTDLDPTSTSTDPDAAPRPVPAPPYEITLSPLPFGTLRAASGFAAGLAPRATTLPTRS